MDLTAFMCQTLLFGEVGKWSVLLEITIEIIWKKSPSKSIVNKEEKRNVI